MATMEAMIAPASSVPRWTGAQKGVALLVALAILFDGFDTQIIGLCLPAIARDWGLEKSAFAPVLAIGTMGIALGSACAGLINDRIGRRWSLIGSVALVGLSSLSLTFATNLLYFAIARFAIGCGIGAAMASATTALAEFTPPHRRSAVISFGILCMPLGGLLSSSSSALLLAKIGWRPMFAIGGALPLMLVVALIVLLPESPAFLSTRPGRADELARVRKRMGMADPIAAPPPRAAGGGIGALLAPALRHDTVLIWAGFFLCLLANYIGISWLPALFADSGASLTQSSISLSANGVGAIIGSILCVLIVQRFGTRMPMLVSGALGAIALAALGLVFASDTPTMLLFALIMVSSLCIAIMQSLLYVLVAQIYPVDLRGSGVGIGMAVGRCGAVASAFVGGWALPLGGHGFFLIDAAIFALGTLAIAFVGRHVAGTRG